MLEFLLQNKEIITLLAGMGTFISAIIAIYTLVEIKKQRLSTYKPEILLKSFLVYINKSPLLLCTGNDELLQFKTDNFNEYKSSNKSEQEFSVSSLYKLENLGFGLAQDVKVTWDFNIKKAVHKVESSLSEGYYFSQYKPLNYYFLKKEGDEEFQISFSNENKIIQSTDYITPINISRHTHFHTIPKDIITLHFLYFIFENELIEKININSYGMDFEDFPKISMKIEYYDINKKKYSRKYKFKTSIVTTQLEDKVDMSKEFGYLLFKIE